MGQKNVKPHDHFIKSALTYPSVVREFFQATLPPDLLKRTDLDSLALVKETFLDDTLKLQEADVLFQATLDGEKGYYLLTEAQSTSDKMMPFRLMKYILAIQDRHVKVHKTKTLPFVFPLVFFTGKGRYRASTDYFDLFGPHKDLARTFWNPHHLVDVKAFSEEDLADYREFQVMAQVLKHIRDPDIIPLLRGLMSRLRALEKEGAIGYIECIVTYMQKAGEISSQEEFEKTLLEGLCSVDEDKLMTWANHYIEKGMERGMERGMQQGMQQGMQSVALRMLQRNRPLDEILEDTGLSLKELKKLQAALH